jgi:hypothetical protein
LRILISKARASPCPTNPPSRISPCDLAYKVLCQQGVPNYASAISVSDRK